ncbi:GNAT family N-acetyltransferase [Joostella sp.]|uniref:GNAT family N-acetyltransferase n=1 Tax=Joostella sp. TaxID=2231138 RepID=UPI003A8D43B4
MILRLAKKSDVDFYYKLVNNSSVRLNSINKDKIQFSEHKKWFYSKVKSEDSLLFVLKNENELVGQIRFDKVYNSWEIDYSISDLYRGEGYGYQILLKGIFEVYYRVNSKVNFTGKVLEANKISAKIFQRIGFELSKFEIINNDKLLIYSLEHKPITNILLSSRNWNYSILKRIKSKLKGSNWLYCNNKTEFSKIYLDVVKPSKVFIPHWSYIIPENIYMNFQCIVFHMTDLPFGRGGSPLQNLIERGYKETKISALRVSRGIDTGPIYFKKNLSLHGTAQEIYLRASQVVKDMIIYIEENEIQPIEQEGLSVDFSRRTPEMSSLEGVDDFEKLYDYIRMLDADGYPKAYIENENFRFEFTRATIKTDKSIIADVRIIKK